VNAKHRLKIGISACLFHPDPERKAAPSKTLQWIEQSTAHWIMSEGALPARLLRRRTTAARMARRPHP
jgi:hypothetical protein